jgi:5-methylcytosine-specific restriction endonuclease McrA
LRDEQHRSIAQLKYGSRANDLVLQRKSVEQKRSVGMPKRRSKVPKKTEAELMFDNEHTCCICRECGRDVLIHHMDGDKNNNDPLNLAIVCLDCHSKVTGERGLGRKYSELEVKKYKRSWEHTVRKKRRLILEPHQKWRKAEEDSFRFEIRKNLYELVSAKNPQRTKEILEVLDLYYVFEGQSHSILDTLHDLVPFYDDSMNALIAEHIPHYFWHLPGPADNKIRRTDIRALDKAIDVLGWMIQYNAMAMKRVPSVKAALRSLHSLFETVSLYNVERLQSRITKSVQLTKGMLPDSGLSDEERKSLIAEMDSFLKEIKKNASESSRGN